jgi:hypothetical protein
MSGLDTEPGATVFQVFAATYDKVHEPIFAKIDFDVDVDARRATLKVPGIIDARGEPIITKQIADCRWYRTLLGPSGIRADDPG